MCEASPANQMSNMRPIEQLLRSSQQNAKAFASNCLTLPSLACSAPTPSGETDASSRQAVRRSGHIDEWHLVNVQVVESQQHTSTPLSCV